MKLCSTPLTGERTRPRVRVGRAPRSTTTRATARGGNSRDGALGAVDEGVNRHSRGGCAPRTRGRVRSPSAGFVNDTISKPKK